MTASPASDDGSNRRWLGAVLATAVVVFSFSSSFIVPALENSLRESINLDLADIGVGVSVQYAAAAIASPPSGWLVDNWGARRTMQASFVVVVIGYTILVLAQGPLHVWVAMAICGIGTGLALPGSNVYVSSVSSVGLGLRLGLRQSSVPAAALGAGVAVSLTAQGVSWRLLMTVAAVAGLVAGLACSLLPPDGPPRRRGAARREYRVNAGRIQTTMPPVPVLAVGALAGVYAAVLSAFLVTSLTHWGYPLSDAGLALIVGSSLGIAARIAWGWLGDRTKKPDLLLGGVVVLGGLAAVCFSLGGSMEWGLFMVWTLFVFGIGHGGLLNMVVLLKGRAAPGRSTGIVQTFIHFGGVVGPFAFLLITDHSSVALAWFALGMASLVTGLWLTARATVWTSTAQLARKG